MPFGLFQATANAFGAKKANKELDALLGQDVSYKANPYASYQLALAKQLYGGRMFGAPQLERNILSTLGNTTSAIDRTATDASQAIAAKTAAQAQADDDFSKLQNMELQNKYGMLSNLNNAYAAMIGEGDKVYNDEVRRYQNKVAIKGAQRANKTNTVNSIFNGLNSDFNDAVSIFSMFGGAKK